MPESNRKPLYLRDDQLQIAKIYDPIQGKHYKKKVLFGKKAELIHPNTRESIPAATPKLVPQAGVSRKAGELSVNSQT